MNTASYSLGSMQAAGTPAAFYKTAGFWQDVLANVVAFGLVALAVTIYERTVAGGRVEELH